MNNNILLESGTNELELMEFLVGTRSFAINISKIIEIMQYCETTPVPNVSEEIEGVFVPRGTLVSVIDLRKIIGVEHEIGPKDLFLVCDFNHMQVAFHVSGVLGIHRISWADISVPDDSDNDPLLDIATGVINIDNKKIIMLDFEKIVMQINKSAGLDTEGIESMTLPADIMCEKHIVVADDSKFLNMLITESLEKIGFRNIISFSNGQDTWEYVSSFGDSGDDITDHIACIISDIEMPKMDGHRLTKLIKDDPVLKNIPVILFSSIINEEMIEKGKAVGADAQFTKPQISDLFAYIIGILS